MPRLIPSLCLLLLAGGCDQVRSLKASNSDERPRADDGDLGFGGDGDTDYFFDSGVPPYSARDAGGWSVPPPYTPPTYECTGTTLRCGSSYCVDVSTSTSHCGACDRACPSGQRCADGECACWGTGQVLCDGMCTVALLGVCGECGGAARCESEPACDDGASHVADWPTVGGGLLRAGYNAGELGVPPLTRGWAVSVVPGELNPVVVVGSRVYATGRGGSQQTNALVALELATGDVVWTKDFGAVGSVGAPTVADCRVYLEHGRSFSGDSTAARLWSLEASSGEAVWGKVQPATTPGFEPPTVTSNTVYGGTSSYEGLYAVARSSAAAVFGPIRLGSSGVGGAAAFHEGELYTFAAGKLQRHDANTGAVIDAIGVRSTVSSRPALSADGTVYLVGPPMAYAFEVKTKRLLWQAGAQVSGSPTLAEGLVLLIEGGVLTARNASTGILAWSASGTEDLNQAPVAAHGFVYVASATQSYAVELATGTVVWQELGGGPLSIGGGRLFVAGNDGILRSYLLSQPPAE